MNTNIVILNGSVVQSIKPIRHFFTIVIKCGTERIRVDIPKKLYRILRQSVKNALQKENSFIQIEGLIDTNDDVAICKNEEYCIAGHRIIAENIQNGKPVDVNLVMVAGVICSVTKKEEVYDVKIGVLEGRRLNIINGTILQEKWNDHNNNDSTIIQICHTVRLSGFIKDSRIFFSKYRLEE